MHRSAPSEILSLDAGVFCDIAVFTDSVSTARLSIALACQAQPFVQAELQKKIAAEQTILLDKFKATAQSVGLNQYRKIKRALVIADFQVISYEDKLRIFPKLATKSLLTATWNPNRPWPERWNSLLNCPW